MPDDDINAAQKAIDEAAKSADPALSSAALPAEPAPVPVIPVPPQEPETAKQPDVSEPALPPQPINETEEKLVSELLETPVVPTEAPKETPAKPISPSGGAKKKSSSGGIIAIIAALLLTLPVAVYFISQQNQQIAETRSKATANTYTYQCNINDPGACGGHPERCHCQGGDACTGTLCEDLQGSCEAQGRVWTENQYGTGMTCCVEQYVANPNGNGCVPGGDDDNGDDDDTTNPTPTPTTGTAPICQNIKIYKDGTQVTNLPSLRAGDAVILAVKGNLTPTRAHFRVNGGSWTETTTTNGSGEFTLAYTVPAGVTEFVIEGEIFTNGAWR